MGEQTPPKDTKAVKFSSTQQAKGQQKVDYFAEQNQIRAEKKQKLKQARKWFVLAGVVAALVIIAVVVVLLTVRSHSGIVIEDEVSEDGETTVESSLAGVEKLTEKVQEAYSPTYSLENGEMKIDGDMDAVEDMYRAALANSANRDRLNTVRLSQIVFYSSIMQYQRVIEVAEDVEPSALNLSERLRFYNLTYLAYSALGNKEQANRYYLLTREIASQVEGYVGE